MTDRHPELPVDPDPAEPSQHPPAGRPAHLRPALLVVVALGGALGSAIRYLVSLALPTASAGWPTATFLVNVVGAFALGLLLEALARSGPDVGWRRAVRLFAGTGFCGALTTYSTLAVEIDLLADHRRWALAVGYGSASVVAGLIAAAAGIGLAARHHRLRARRGASGSGSSAERIGAS